MTDQQRAAMQAALEALEDVDGTIMMLLGSISELDPSDGSAGAKVRGAIASLRAALGEDVVYGGARGGGKSTTQQDLRAALAQQEPDWESRAEIAEQQVVSLSEELAHCKGLLRKQQERAEPVASLMTHLQSGDVELVWNDDGFDRAMWLETPLYTSPPPRKPLSSAQIRAIEVEVAQSQRHDYPTDAEAFARAIERAHGIGGEHEPT
jgi:hypothetical protein